MILEEDTLYYRADHPAGFLFSAGNAAPSEDDGWAAAPGDLPVMEGPTYECTTLAAFAELLRTEREAGVAAADALRLATDRLAGAAVVITTLRTENTQLAAENAALRAQHPASET